VRVLVRQHKIELTEDVRTRADQSLRFALGRFSPRIERVILRLTDLNGPRGGVDERCRIEVRLRPSGGLLVEDGDSSPSAAINRAADRAARAVRRRLDRERALVPLRARVTGWSDEDPTEDHPPARHAPQSRSAARLARATYTALPSSRCS